MIQFSCPYCTAVMKFDDAFAGKTVKCLNCQHEMMAPELVEAAVPPPPPSPAPDAAAQPPEAPASTTSAEAAPATVAPPPVPPAPPEDEILDRETLHSFIHKFLILLGLIVLLRLADLLAGVDMVAQGIWIRGWLHLILGMAIIVFMVLILSPLRKLVPYYIGLTFRLRPRLAAEPELKPQVSKAATYFILLVYLAVFYWAVVVSLQDSTAWAGLILVAQLGVAIIGLVLLVLFIQAFRPLLRRASDTLTDKAMAATQKLDSKPCAGCGARVPLTAKFCPSCGKPS